MRVLPTELPDVLVIEPHVFGDARGFFFESFNQKAFRDATGLEVDFVQDNHSKSSKNVLRGLHYQLPPRTQGRIVRVIAGVVFDVAVDIRKDSITYGKWVGAILSAENKKQLWIPPGFAHGFLTLSETSEFLYKTTEYYSPDHERCIVWNDPEIGIGWPLSGNPLVSVKDQAGSSFRS